MCWRAKEAKVNTSSGGDYPTHAGPAACTAVDVGGMKRRRQGLVTHTDRRVLCPAAPAACTAVDVQGTYQLTALLLYVQQLSAAATAAGRRSFWADWLRLLPGPHQGTAPFGTWSDAELAALRFEPYKVWFVFFLGGGHWS